MQTSGEHGRLTIAAFGRRIRELREEHDISQDELARKTDIHSTAIGRLERGRREPRLLTILRLADGLGVAPGELVNELDHRGGGPADHGEKRKPVD